MNGAEGDLLRALRAEEGLSQADVATRVGCGRSTLANVEGAREPLSPKLRLALIHAFPQWRLTLESGVYRPSVSSRNAGLEVLELTIAYVFQDSLSPSEIIQIRRVRARRSGVQMYAMGLRRTDGQTFEVEWEDLWGGHLVDHSTGDPSTYMRAFNFFEPLHAGQTHEFAMRTWVDRDAEPGTEIRLDLTAPAQSTRIHLASQGPHGFAEAWSFGPGGEPGPGRVLANSPVATPVPVHSRSLVTVAFCDIVPGQYCGVGWKWEA